jgi:short-subunit dehydrogenase
MIKNEIMEKNFALVTGASGGMGLEFARLLAKDNYNLLLIARSESKLKSIASELEIQYAIKVLIQVKDLSQPSAADEIFEFTHQNNLIVDVLINNAGFGNFGFFTETAIQKEIEMVDLNIKTLTVMTKFFVKEMVARGKGKILNIASTAAFQPGPLMAVYYASKAYVLSFSEALSNELQGTGVTVTTLCPGPTQTGFEKAASLQESGLFKTIKPANATDVALVGYKALMKGKTMVIYGWLNKLIVFANRITPRTMIVKIVRKMSEKI